MKTLKKTLFYVVTAFVLSIMAFVVATTLLVNHFDTTVITKTTECDANNHCTTETTRK